MTSFKYSALSPDGIKVSGVVKAIDEYTAVDKIKAKYPVVLKIEEIKESAMDKILNFEVGSKYDAKALSVMCSQFAVILESGVTIDGCLSMIAAQTVDKKLKKMLELSAEDVAQGTPIATAFEKNYSGLPVTFIETIRAGETSGTLTSSFKTLAEFYEKSYTLDQKVRSALSYPMFVLGVGVVVLIVIMAFVMPKFIAMFDDLGGELPFITRILISITNFFEKYWLIIVLIIVLGFVFFKVYTHSEEGLKKWSAYTLKMPVFGNINTLQGATEFSSTMATLLHAGLTVSDSLIVTSKVMSNYTLSENLKLMAEKISTGSELGKLMKQDQYFPQVLKEMVGVGEKTGELEKALNTMSDYYNQEYNYEVNKVISKLEPTMLIFLAIFAGFIVIALYLPMFTMYSLM